MVLVGDVTGKTAIIVDDMADTCGTLVKAADVVIQHGAKDVIAIVTHGILSGNAIEALNGSKLKKIVVTNTVPHEEKKEACDRIETIDVSPTVRMLGHDSSSPQKADIKRRSRRLVDARITERAFPSSLSMRP
jgi:phosphoribosylpyrophosphate synthetase